MTLQDWIMSNWEVLLSAAGIGGSSGILGKKLTDKAQDSKIKANTDSIKNTGEKVIKIMEVQTGLKAQLDINDALDKEFKTNFNQHRSDMRADVKDIKDSLKMLTSHLLK